MKKIFYNMALFAGISFTSITLLNSCSKDNDDMASSNAAYYFTNNTNRDLLIQTAIDDGANITTNFSGITFHFSDSSKFSGTINASNDLFSVEGTWAVDESYTNISFNFPADKLPALSFLNKQWQFLNSNAEAIDLKAANGENDEVHFVRK